MHTLAASIPSKIFSTKMFGPSGLLTPPAMMIPRPAVLVMVMVCIAGGEGEVGEVLEIAESGGEEVDFPSGELLLADEKVGKVK